MSHTVHTGSERIVLAMTALGVLALVGVFAGAVGAGFVDALGQLARAVATALGASKEVALIAEIGAEALGRIAKVLWL